MAASRGDLRVEPASPADLAELTQLHLANVDASEFSMLLGPRFVRAFYEFCLTQPQSEMQVLKSGDNIVGMTMTWSDHYGLTRAYRNRVLIRLALHLAGLALSGRWSTIRAILAYALGRDNQAIPGDIAPYCVEMTILDHSRRADPASVTAFFRMFGAGVERLRSASPGGIWASARADNAASVRMIRHFIRPTEEFLIRDKPVAVRCFVHRKG